jgi:enterochelin esterase-like enzyme
MTGTQTLTVEVRYPLERGRLALRAEPDWERDIAPVSADAAAGRFTFRLRSDREFVYFKPVLHDEAGLHWARGENSLCLAGGAPPGDADSIVHPFFFEEPGCTECDLATRESRERGGGRRFRVFLPAGYHENSLRRFPVVFMQDGQNLFFPGEAHGGEHWRVRETLERLDAMSLVRPAIVVGVYPHDRMRDYSAPGYESYGRFLAEDLKPWIDRTYATRPAAAETAVVGSSLGGVVSFYLAWQWPNVFGMAGCLSSTFGWRDDLMARVESEPRRHVRFYLDSGWPGDNYEVTRGMRDRLAARGWEPGRDLFYLAYPEARHDERAWAGRLHVPFQYFFSGSGNGHAAGAAALSKTTAAGAH